MKKNKYLRIVIILTMLLALIPVGSVSAKMEKVSVCHREGNGGYHLITIAKSALPAHMAHGDALPTDSVPGHPGEKFASDCSFASVPQKELVQTLTVLPDGASVVSQPLLLGQAYELKASGTYTYKSTLEWADAEWYMKGGVMYKGDTEGSVPYVLDLSINGYSTNTDWGAYQPTHVYTKQWTGTGATLSFSIFDSAWSDNVGFLTVEIWKVNW